jgi:GxxExxY protein
MALVGDPEVNRITGLICQAAIAVHRVLGPGLLESAYLSCLVYELRERGLDVEADLPLPLSYKGVKLDKGYRIDARVNACVIVELKCVNKLAPIHEAQLITYLKLTRCPVGLLLNFKVPRMTHGIKRKINPELGPHLPGSSSEQAGSPPSK